MTAAPAASITHAYVGYDSNGTAIWISADEPENHRDNARDAAATISAGGRIERMTLEAAREVRLYEVNHV